MAGQSMMLLKTRCNGLGRCVLRVLKGIPPPPDWLLRLPSRPLASLIRSSASFAKGDKPKTHPHIAEELRATSPFEGLGWLFFRKAFFRTRLRFFLGGGLQKARKAKSPGIRYVAAKRWEAEKEGQKRIRLRFKKSGMS